MIVIGLHIDLLMLFYVGTMRGGGGCGGGVEVERKWSARLKWFIIIRLGFMIYALYLPKENSNYNEL
jgi:hypothetical protein